VSREQAAQLGAKALLHGVGRGGVARGHDLVRLLETAVEVAGLSLSEEVRESAIRLSRHYQPSRYPDALPGGTPHERYTADDAEGALADAEMILREVDRSIERLRAAAQRESLDDEPS
jgi:HEPN domain-containing protein